MANRATIVTQADVTRTIKACQKAGLTIARVVVRVDGVAIETNEVPGIAVNSPGIAVEQTSEVVL